MKDETFFHAIDVGTTKVCTITGEKTGSREFKILAHSIVPCEGLKKGTVVDLVATERAIRTSVEQVEKKTGIRVLSAYVGVTGAHVTFENRKHNLEWAGKHGVVTAKDLSQVPQTVASSCTTSERGVIHAIPLTYSVDSMGGIRNPMGMHTQDLGVESHVVTGSTPLIDKLLEAVARTGVRTEALVLQPLASSEAVLTPAEREEGVVLVDIGGGTTDLIAIKNGRMCYTGVIPVAGHQFTNDICLTYNTSYPTAEEVKLKYAHTEPYVIRLNEEISLPVMNSEKVIRIPRRDICTLIRERSHELIRLIKLKIQEAEIWDMSKERLVLTGGTSNLPGLESLMKRTLTTRARLGIPNGHHQYPEELKAPAHATSVGILMWAMNQGHLGTTLPTMNGNGSRMNGGHHGLFSRLGGQIRNLFPVDILSFKKGGTQ